MSPLHKSFSLTKFLYAMFLKPRSSLFPSRLVLKFDKQIFLWFYFIFHCWIFIKNNLDSATQSEKCMLCSVNRCCLEQLVAPLVHNIAVNKR